MWKWAAVGGLGCVATGLLPLDAAGSVLLRIAPVLLFLVAVTVVAELADTAEVFDLAAVETARLARGSTLRLYLLILLLATLTTVVLSLDTTAVLLTPVVLSLTAELELPAVPFAMATCWLANTASLLLPVSNLTNLLALDRLGLTFAGFAERMWAPALAAVVVTCVFLLVRYRRDLGGRYVTPRRRRPADPPTFWFATACCVAILPALVAGVPFWLASSVAAVLLVGLYAFRRPTVLRVSLVPWRLVLLVSGLFLVMDTLDRHGLRSVLATFVGDPTAQFAPLRTAAVTAALGNVTNNLPAYYAMEHATGGDPVQVLAVLLGANVGPLVCVWGSLATLLWRERCRARGVHVSAGRFAATGAFGVPLLLLGTTAALLATS